MQPILTFVDQHGLAALYATVAVLFVGGFVKGAIGFALPLIGVAGLGAFLPAQQAVALLIIPMLVSNLWQSCRTGFGAAWGTLWRFRLLLLVLTPAIVLFAQLLATAPEKLFYLTLGLGVTAFAISQLAGWRAAFMARAPRLSEVGAGLVGGFFGGIAGIWGPPVTLYLLAIDLSKEETMRALGVIFGLGSVALTVGQLLSGVLNAQTA
ncbi:MAG: TSUP family transporter, partial [Rubrimonas sp.]